MKTSIKYISALILIASLTAVSCDVVNSDSDLASSEVQVKMQIQTGATAGTGQLMASQQVINYEFQEVKLYIGEMELESVSEDSLDFEEENFIVDVPLDGSPINLSQRSIEAGLYDEFELEVERPDDDDIDSVSDVDFVDGSDRYSIVVKGLYQGVEFTYRSTEDFEIEMDLIPVLEVTESESTALVVNIDINQWFKDSDGSDLDPNDSNNFEQIEENIENSFEGFEEDDDDNDDDDDD